MKIENLSEYLERLGIMTHKVAQGGELDRFRQAESNRNNVMVFPGVNKPARIQEIGRVGIQQSGGTNSALISAVQMLARSSPMAVYRSGVATLPSSHSYRIHCSQALKSIERIIITLIKFFISKFL